MKKLMNVLMLSCKKASGLIEKKLHFSLSSVERVQLKMHTSMCEMCRSYQNQSEGFDELLNNQVNLNSSTSSSSPKGLSQDSKDNILKEIEKNK